MARTRSSTKNNKNNSSAEVSNAVSKTPGKKDNQDIKNLIKVSFERAIQKQRLSYAQGIAARAGEGAEAAAIRGDAEAVPAEIDSDSWLDTQHVEGTIQSLVAERPKLRNTVGIFPVFTIETMERLAQDAAEEKVIQDLGLPTRRTAAGDLILDERPLPSLEGLNKRQLAAREKEAKKRIEDAKERREQASALLDENDLTTNELFQLFLESMADSRHAFLGNPKTPNIRFDDCTQFIIPIRKNANHYTTAVVHLYEEDEKWIASIKYYDSMGGEMDDNLQAQLVAFFTNRGYDPQYECVSESDQKESYNCSVFASFKSIDIANENIGEEDRLLDKLTDDNYEQRMNYYRYIVTLKLKEMGQNVSLSEGLKDDIVQQQKEFTRLSKQSQQVTVFNRLLKDMIAQNNDVINKVQANRNQKTAKSSNVSKAKPISDLDPKLLFAQCDEQCNKMNELLKEKSQKAKKTAKVKSDIKLLMGAISAFKTIKEDLKRDLAKITGQKRALASLTPTNVNPGWFENLTWKKTLIYGGIGGVVLFVGLPYALAIMLQVMPANPFMSIVLGAGVFALGVQSLNWVVNLTNIDKKKPEVSNQTQTLSSGSSLSDDDDQEEELADDLEEGIINIEENVPAIVPRFNKARSKVKPTLEREDEENSDDVVFVSEASLSSPPRKKSA